MSYVIKYCGGVRENYAYDMLWVKNLGSNYSRFKSMDTMIYFRYGSYFLVNDSDEKHPIGNLSSYLDVYRWASYKETEDYLIWEFKFTEAGLPTDIINIYQAKNKSASIDIEPIDFDMTNMETAKILEKIGINPIAPNMSNEREREDNDYT